MTKLNTNSLLPILKNLLFKEGILVFLFSYAIIFGPAFTLFSEFAYDISMSPDIESYTQLSKFDFDQSPIRRYRIIIPAFAAAVNYILGPIFSILKPYSFPGPDFSLCMSFLVVNSLLIGLFGTIIYSICRTAKTSILAALIATIVILSSRWTAYYAGLPYTDSLYLIAIGLGILGIMRSNPKLIIASIIIGPWAKESFIFIAPVIFFYAPMKKLNLIAWFGLSGLLVFSFRFLIDFYHQLPINESLSSDLNHFNFILISLKRLLSFHGVYEIFSIIGIWSFAYVALINKNIRHNLSGKLPSFTLLYIGIILIHILLSTSVARMLYLLTPIIGISIAVIFDYFIKTIKPQIINNESLISQEN